MTPGHNKIVEVVGLGMLGASITERLLNQGLKINIYNRNMLCCMIIKIHDFTICFV